MEGQLKQVQEKLVQTQRKHEDILKIERLEMAKTYEEMKQQLIKEMSSNGLPQTQNVSDNITNGNDDRQNSTPAIIISKDSPNINTKLTKGIAPIKQISSVPIMVSPRQQGHYSPVVPKLRPRKKTEQNIIDSLGLESALVVDGITKDEFDKRTRRSLDGLVNVPPKTNGDRLTIAQLVENSQQSPGTIAAIRKKLKEDGLTPKIKKKFEKQVQQELPAVKDTSQHSNKSIPIEGKRNERTEQKINNIN